MKNGTVKWYDSQKGYGFIEVEGEKDVFVHSTSIHANDSARYLTEGEKVQFDVEKGPRGPQASNVTKL